MLLILFGVIDGEKLNCQFRDIEIYDGSLYSCEVKALDNSFNNMTIDGYNGKHQINKEDSDVKTIYIHDTYTKFIPANLGILMKLNVLLIANAQLIEIRSTDFQRMQDLEYLGLPLNSLKFVPLDAFSSLTELKYISLSKNEITELPNGLFDNNLNLVEIYLQYNHIQFIGSGLFNGLTVLNKVGLIDNICVDNYYENVTEIIQMKMDIKTNCTNSIEVALTTTTQNPLETHKLNCEHRNLLFGSISQLFSCTVQSIKNLSNKLSNDGSKGVKET